MQTNDALAYQVDDLAPALRHADPYGLAHDSRDGALYIADAASGSILRVHQEHVRRIATIQASDAMGVSRIGGLALTADGTLFVTRLGHGQAGTVFRLDPAGGLSPFAKLPPQFWRSGVTHDAEANVLYTTQFLMSKFGAHEGSIVSIDLATGEPSTVLDGFLKPVGIAKLGNMLVVADARQHAVFRVQLSGGRAVSRYQLASTSDRPDSVCACDTESVLVTGYDEASQVGTVQRIWLDGRSQLIATGSWEPRGVATDGTRALVAVRRSDTVRAFDLAAPAAS
ncbi:MAG: hypothetical protein H0T79_23295 [Deltaproteobacteria bacterium]|nr:hypothetical protein [Deltaproteobacteria bacterium]